ncbi:hypothetical protein [Halocatena halophila]|uniref:hypothetical protein n=1 Tax=Halocatena halophila TaxID=2814576 RepID=UPI002ED512A1
MSTDGSPEPDVVRQAVRDGIVDGVRSVLSIAIWSVLSIFCLLSGIGLVALGTTASGVVSLGLVGLGGVLVVCSVYLLYLLHWVDRRR